MPSTQKARYFWPFLLVLFVTDCTTKDLVVDRFDAVAGSRPVIDSFVRLSFVQNPGTAFGFDIRPLLGAWARPVLILGMLVVLSLLVRIYATTAPRARLAGAALGLACGGAIGNIFDRLRFPAGVVDFIDVGVGGHRFWIFNVADVGVAVGAVLLAFVLLRDEAPASATT